MEKEEAILVNTGNFGINFPKIQGLLEKEKPSWTVYRCADEEPATVQIKSTEERFSFIFENAGRPMFFLELFFNKDYHQCLRLFRIRKPLDDEWDECSKSDTDFFTFSRHSPDKKIDYRHVEARAGRYLAFEVWKKNLSRECLDTFKCFTEQLEKAATGSNRKFDFWQLIEFLEKFTKSFSGRNSA